jgi:hypothetical protein
VQELVDGPDYREGNAMAFLVTGSGKRTARSSDDTPDQAPRLVVEFIERPNRVRVPVSSGLDDVEEGADGRVHTKGTGLALVTDDGKQTVGIRFEGVAIPAGAFVSRAWLDLNVDEASADEGALMIRGEASADAAAFTTSAGDVSRRPRTDAEVPWTISSWVAAGKAAPAQQTQDLAAVVREIIDTPGYRTGNAMVFVVSGRGGRTVDSYDRAPGRAPVLHVEFYE